MQVLDYVGKYVDKIGRSSSKHKAGKSPALTSKRSKQTRCTSLTLRCKAYILYTMYVRSNARIIQTSGNGGGAEGKKRKEGCQSLPSRPSAAAAFQRGGDGDVRMMAPSLLFSCTFSTPCCNRHAAAVLHAVLLASRLTADRLAGYSVGIWSVYVRIVGECIRLLYRL